MTGAQSITQSQGGKWHGRYGVAACPVCQPERRSDQTALTVSDTPEGRLLAHCKKSGCSFGDLAAALGLSAGDFTKPDPAEAARRHAEGIAASRYCFGDSPTLADCCLVPQIFNAQRFQVDLAGLPRVMAAFEACAALPAVQRAHPSQCPDATP